MSRGFINYKGVERPTKVEVVENNNSQLLS